MAGKKARFLAPTEIVGAFLFSQTRPWKTVRSQKSRYADANLVWSGSASPSRKEEWGRKVKSPHCFTASPTPNDCCPRKRHVWGTGQSRWHPKSRRLCCLSVPSVCQENRPTAEAISKTLGSSACVSDTPHTRHSNVCNSGNPPIFATERINRMVAPQLGQNGAGW